MLISDFDKIYILHLSNNTDRYVHILNEFKRMNLSDKIDIWWTCKRNISIDIGNNLNSIHTRYYDDFKRYNKDIYAAVFNCAFEHYTIIKTSYERGFNNIMIFEDDICFIENREYFDKCISLIPDNYKICKLYHTNNSLNICTDFSKSENLFKKCNNHNKYLTSLSTAAYCLNRIGMELMINSYHKNFTCADKVFENIDQNDIYINTKKIIYINPLFESNIRANIYEDFSNK